MRWLMGEVLYSAWQQRNVSGLASAMAPAALEQPECQYVSFGGAKECASPGHQLSIDGCDPKLQGSRLHDSLLKTVMVLCSTPNSSSHELEWRRVPSVQPYMPCKQHCIMG